MLAQQTRSAKSSKPTNRTMIPYATVIPELDRYGLVMIPLENKRPIFKQWNKVTNTPSQLDVFRGYNIGIVTGVTSGITVLDLDVKDDGIKMWSRISSAFPEVVTPIVKTPSNGLHIYFRYNKRLHSFSRYTLRGKRIGWDLLNNDRQCVAPPSISSGKKYKWIVHPAEASFASMPKWLEDYLLDVKFFQ